MTTLSEAEARIKPPVPDFDEKDHEIAKWRFVADKLMEELYSMHFYLNVYNTEDSLEQRLERANSVLENRFITRRIEPEGPWGEFELVAQEYRWDDLQEALYGFHIGDCVAVACTCDRCYAERYYEMNTAPPGKTIGSRWWSEYEQLKEKMNDV